MSDFDEHTQRRGGFREVMQNFSGEFDMLSPDFDFPENAADGGSFNGLNLRSPLDVRCANLAEWTTTRVVDWFGSNADKLAPGIDKNEIRSLIQPGLLAISEVHAVIPLISGPDSGPDDWVKTAETSPEFTVDFANKGTSVFYIMRRWLGLRRTLANVFEYDPAKLTVEEKISFSDVEDDPVASAEQVAKKLRRHPFSCVALQAIDTGSGQSLYDAVSRVYTRGAEALIYPEFGPEDVANAIDKSIAVRRDDLNGATMQEQMTSALNELF